MTNLKDKLRHVYNGAVGAVVPLSLGFKALNLRNAEVERQSLLEEGVNKSDYQPISKAGVVGSFILDAVSYAVGYGLPAIVVAGSFTDPLYYSESGRDMYLMVAGANAVVRGLLGAMLSDSADSTKAMVNAVKVTRAVKSKN